MTTYLTHDQHKFHIRAHLDCYARCFSIFADKPRGRLLDVAAGSGYTSYVLRGLGFAVTATEINTSQFIPHDLEVQAVDLNQGLPYESNSFPNVLALEIIEHLEAPSRFVREIARVLAPGGTAIISTPNITSWSSKLRFALKNEFNLFYNVSKRLHDPLDDRAAGHISPMPLWLLTHFVEQAGLEVKRTHYTEERFGLTGNWIPSNLMLEVQKPHATA